MLQATEGFAGTGAAETAGAAEATGGGGALAAALAEKGGVSADGGGAVGVPVHAATRAAARPNETNGARP